MSADIRKVHAAVRQALDADDLTTLFQTALGWDAPTYTGQMVEGAARATQVASKRGVGVWLVENADSQQLDKLDKAISLVSHERLIVSRGPDGLLWRWPERRRSGSVRRSRITQRNPGELTDVVERLSALRFEPGTRDSVTVLDVRDRVRRYFNTEKVTETFFKEFNACHQLMGGAAAAAGRKAIPGLIEGIPTIEDRRWYASVLLNRLMFLYFLQRKGLLNNERDYLRDRLERLSRDSSADRRGFAFYGSFLIPLFHEAIGSQGGGKLTDESRNLIGDVPYLNGGVFAKHPLETKYSIRVSDVAFARVFDVFDRYRWHLDDREEAEGNEINPDILGHIFERYVNQKQTGAFYTPDDATGWMASRSIGVVLLAKLENLGVAVGRVAAANPRRYLPAELFIGDSQAEVQAGYPQPGGPDAAGWSRSASVEVGLPDETRWEVRDRLRHAAATEAELVAGLGRPEDALDLNLDLIPLVIDAVDALTPESLDAFWRELMQLSVLDPTCGSGAFLLASLDVLEEVAEAVIDRAMDLSSIVSTELFKEISKVRPEARRLHVRQELILESLYGADIAEEAVEIARLRLYLALVAVMYDRRDLRPLPDLDFNLVVGNLLVGINSSDDMEKVLGGAIWAHSDLAGLRQRLASLAEALDSFRHAQGSVEGGDIAQAKRVAEDLAKELNEALDAGLHKAAAAGTELAGWLAAHRPLHYLSAFPDVMRRGGFDVVIGNPPYVAKSEVWRTYQYSGVQTEHCPDIYAPCVERSAGLLASHGVLALVLPYSAVWSEEFSPLRKVLSQAGRVYVACFGRNPDSLFRGVGVRNAVTFMLPGRPPGLLITSAQRWTAKYRPALFGTLRWQLQTDDVRGEKSGWLRLGTAFALDFWRRAREVCEPIDSTQRAGAAIYSKKTCLYWLPVAHRPLRTIDQTGHAYPTNERVLWFRNPDVRDAAFALLASRLGLLLWNAASDDFNVVLRTFESLPAVPRADRPDLLAKLAAVGRSVAEALEERPEAKLWTPYAGYWVESIDTRIAADKADEAIRILFQELGLESRWDEFEAWYWRTMKSTGERPGTERGHEPPTRAIKGGPRRRGPTANRP